MHLTDLVAPGTLDDAQRLYGTVASGEPFRGAVVIKPLRGQPIAVDINARRDGERLVADVRLAADVPPASVLSTSRPAALVFVPNDDEALQAYAESILQRMPEPTVEELGLRLRRLYPHVDVRPDGDRWIVERETTARAAPHWWQDDDLPRVAYDTHGLIIDANPSAQAMLGSPLIGHHWHELVTTGSTDAVDQMIAILRETGGAVSRFRMPGASGSLVEFDSYTTVEPDGQTLVTIMRPVG